MKNRVLKPGFWLLVLTSLGHTAHSASLNIEWNNPDQYQDIRSDRYEGKKAFRERLFDNLGAQLEELAKLLPEDQELHLVVSDLRLAGKLRQNRVRVDPYSYPPKILFHYQLTGADATILRDGDEALKGRQSMRYRGPGAEDISFYYEKEMLVEWFDRTFFHVDPQ